MNAEKSFLQRVLESHYPTISGDKSLVDFRDVEQKMKAAYQREQREWFQMTVGILSYLDRERGKAADLARSGAVPLGLENENSVRALGPGQHAIVFTGERDSVGDQILASAMQSVHWLHEPAKMSLTAHGSLNPRTRLFDPVRSLVAGNYDSSVRTVVEGKSGQLLDLAGYPNHKSGMMDMVAGALASDPEAIARGETFAGVETRHGFIPLVGPRNRIVVDNLAPQDFGEQWGVSLNYLLNQLQYTPFAKIVRGVGGLLLHMPVSNLLGRNKSKWLEAFSGLMIEGQIQPIITDEALPHLQGMRDLMNLNLSAFNAPYDAVKAAEVKPAGGFHMIGADGEATRAVAFTPD